MCCPFVCRENTAGPRDIKGEQHAQGFGIWSWWSWIALFTGQGASAGKKQATSPIEIKTRLVQNMIPPCWAFSFHRHPVDKKKIHQDTIQISKVTISHILQWVRPGPPQRWHCQEINNAFPRLGFDHSVLFRSYCFSSDYFWTQIIVSGRHNSGILLRRCSGECWRAGMLLASRHKAHTPSPGSPQQPGNIDQLFNVHPREFFCVVRGEEGQVEHIWES